MTNINAGPVHEITIRGVDRVGCCHSMLWVGWMSRSSSLSRPGPKITRIQGINELKEKWKP